MPPTRIWLALGIALMVAISEPRAQQLSSARGLAISASTPLVDDYSAIDWNPAALAVIHDWEFGGSSYYLPNAPNHPITFQELTVATRLSEGQSVALRISPGMEASFTIPATFTIQDSTNRLTTRYDQQLFYREWFAGAYAVRLREDFDAGISMRYLATEVDHIDYTLDSTNILRGTPQTSNGSRLSFDVGARWNPEPEWILAAVMKNAFSVDQEKLPASLANYALELPAFLRAGIGFTGLNNAAIGVEGDTKRRLRFGGEWTPIPHVSVRGGIYVDETSGAAIDAVGFGLGYEYRDVQLDVGVLRFTAEGLRRGSADVADFSASELVDIGYNRFSGDRIQLSAKFNLSAGFDQLARIERVSITTQIFPASRVEYAIRPIGTASVHNITDRPVNVKVSFALGRYSDAPTESRPQIILPGDTAEVPLYAVLNSTLSSVTALAAEEADVYVATADHSRPDDHLQTTVIVRGRNDWNGDVRLLRFFVTPDDPAIVSTTREQLLLYKPILDTVPSQLQQTTKARILFDEFAKFITYVADPEKTADYVQYPKETLQRGGGDCDDLCVCYASLLTSVGISTAFVDVVPPERPQDGHLYLLVDTGIDPSMSQLVSDNTNRFVIRTSPEGRESIWLPVETTALKHGFEEAWKTGAEEYVKDVELGPGVLNGWVRVVDYEPTQ